MLMETENVKIIEELKIIRKDIDYIKEHMIDMDSFLTKKESKQLDESIKNFREGKTTALEDFKKELGL